jgi:GNAT superfamily N-acetyltransferase
LREAAGETLPFFEAPSTPADPRMDISIHQVEDLAHRSLDGLIAESRAQGFRFLRRLADEWRAGTNRFDAPGEALFVATCDGRVVGVCGLNADPYAADARTGRVRHLYVAAHYRRAGVGRALIARVVAAANRSFTRLTLRTDTLAGDAFYRALGFQRAEGVVGATHELPIGGEDG